MLFTINSLHVTDTQDEQLQAVIAEGDLAKQKVVEYVDWLVTTINEAMPQEHWQLPTPHPCTQQLTAVAEQHLDSDYHDLVNAVERHTRCSAAYCLRKKHGQQEATCRFNYPRPEQQSTDIEFEQLPDGTVRATVITKRNDLRVNSHNRVMLQNWRANIDIQVIVNVEACARYMAKYAAKGEPRSKAATAIFKTSVDKLTSESDATTALRTSMLRCIGERDFSAQETAHQLLSEPLYSCTYTFVCVSLDGSRQVCDQSGDQSDTTLVTNPSTLQLYANRLQYERQFPGITSLNLFEFVKLYCVIYHEIRKRSQEVIVRTFPKYSPNPQGQWYGRYCKYQLIQHKPWSAFPENAWDGEQDEEADDQVYTDAYRHFLHSDIAQRCLPQFAEELNRAEEHLSHEDNSDEEDSHQEQQQNQDEWMLLCRLNQRFDNVQQQGDSSYDWTAAAHSYTADILGDCPTWIKTRRQEARESINSCQQRHMQPVELHLLNREQQTAYDTVSCHYHAHMNGEAPQPLRMIICGTAGTGKSFLITAIAQTLGSTCLLTGTTGLAGFNICGTTLHSTLQLPIQSHNKQDLQGPSLARLQQRVTGKHYLIVDEMSMLGQRMMSWVDKRLRQATGHLEQPLGGFSLILIGDFGQLPPVGDTPLFAPPPAHPLAQHGHIIYKLFNTVVVLNQIQRQNGPSPAVVAFRELLMRLRDGKTTEDDWKQLLQRSPHTCSTSFTDAVHLFYDKNSVAQYNMDKLQSLHKPIARINAIHSHTAAASAKSDEAGGLEPVVFLAEGAKVMLTCNLWQEVGLCNGSPGTVISLLFQDEQGPPSLPIAVLVHFRDYTGPVFNSTPGCIPVPPVTFEWNSGSRHHSRQQLPLRLRYALTIHKSQGQTLPKAVIDIGASERVAGCTFVALSRLRCLEDSIIQPMTLDRLLSINHGRRLQERLQEEERLKELAHRSQASL